MSVTFYWILYFLLVSFQSVKSMRETSGRIISGYLHSSEVTGWDKGNENTQSLAVCDLTLFQQTSLFLPVKLMDCKHRVGVTIMLNCSQKLTRWYVQGHFDIWQSALWCIKWKNKETSRNSASHKPLVWFFSCSLSLFAVKLISAGLYPYWN